LAAKESEGSPLLLDFPGFSPPASAGIEKLLVADLGEEYFLTDLIATGRPKADGILTARGGKFFQGTFSLFQIQFPEQVFVIDKHAFDI